jgi:hypothetical protein
VGKLEKLYYTDGMRWMPLHAFALFSVLIACNVNSQPGSAPDAPACQATAPTNGDTCYSLEICWYPDPACGESATCSTAIFAYCPGVAFSASLGDASPATWVVTTEIVSPDAGSDASGDADADADADASEVASDVVDGQQQGEVVDGQQQGDVVDASDAETSSEIGAETPVEAAADETDSNAPEADSQ